MPTPSTNSGPIGPGAQRPPLPAFGPSISMTRRRTGMGLDSSRQRTTGRCSVRPAESRVHPSLTPPSDVLAGHIIIRVRVCQWYHGPLAIGREEVVRDSWI